VNAMASFDGTLRVFFIRNSNALAAQMSALSRDLAGEIESKPCKKQPVRLTMFYRLHIA